jgi:hypothetical protein
MEQFHTFIFDVMLAISIVLNIYFVAQNKKNKTDRDFYEKEYEKIADSYGKIVHEFYDVNLVEPEPGFFKMEYVLKEKYKEKE